MSIVLRLKLYKILLYTARIAYEKTYDMREILICIIHLCKNMNLRQKRIK